MKMKVVHFAAGTETGPVGCPPEVENESVGLGRAPDTRLRQVQPSDEVCRCHTTARQRSRHALFRVRRLRHHYPRSHPSQVGRLSSHYLLTCDGPPGGTAPSHRKGNPPSCPGGRPSCPGGSRRPCRTNVAWLASLQLEPSARAGAEAASGSTAGISDFL